LNLNKTKISGRVGFKISFNDLSKLIQPNRAAFYSTGNSEEPVAAFSRFIFIAIVAMTFRSFALA
jgi:hypothetical protein